MKASSALVMLVLSSLACSRSIYAESEHIGPLQLAAHVNGVEIPSALVGTLELSTAKGDFNANADVTLSSSTSSLRNNVLAVFTTLLPIQIPTWKCSLSITKILDLAISSQDNEADIKAKLLMSLRECTILDAEDVNVPIAVAIIAAASPPHTLKWKIVRPPVLGIPRAWMAILELTKGSPQAVLQDLLNRRASIDLQAALQDLLNRHASSDLPQITGVRAAIQGASFGGDEHNISFRVKADAHADGPNFTSLLSLIGPALDSILVFEFGHKGK
jgi:hypothetical protein